MSVFNKLKNLFADPYAEDLSAKQEQEILQEEVIADDVMINFEPDEEEILQEKIIEIEEEKDENLNESISEEQVTYINGLTKTSKGFAGKLKQLLNDTKVVDEDFFEELEDIMISSDISVQTTLKLSNEIRKYAQQSNKIMANDLKPIIVELTAKMFGSENFEIEVNKHNPFIIFVSGVNGAGKTTSIGKLTNYYKKQGKKILLVPADTFRAGAINQLVEWANRNEVDYVNANEGQDPASVVFDGMRQLEEGDYDICFIDTSGRLQNKVNLMKELEKMYKVVNKTFPDAPHESLLVIDANTGNNGISQAKEFSKITDVTGIVLTKLDGTAKGGIAFSIKEELNIPIKFVGLGEQIDDIRPFNVEEYLIGIFKDLI